MNAPEVLLAGANLDAIGSRVRELHTEARALAGKAIERALEAGELLCTAKARLAHGEFGPWVEMHCGFSDRTARRYMRLHDNRDLLPYGVGIKAALESIKTDTVAAFNIDAVSPFDWIRYDLADGTRIDITPAAEHPGYMHIGCMRPASDGGAEVIGTRRPMLPRALSATLDHFIGTRWRGQTPERCAWPEGFHGNPWLKGWNGIEGGAA